MADCSECETPFPTGAKFCAGCGNRVDAAGADEFRRPGYSRLHRGGFSAPWIAAVSGAFLLGGVLTWLFMAAGKHDRSQVAMQPTIGACTDFERRSIWHAARTFGDLFTGGAFDGSWSGPRCRRTCRQGGETGPGPSPRTSQFGTASATWPSGPRRSTPRTTTRRVKRSLTCSNSTPTISTPCAGSETYVSINDNSTKRSRRTSTTCALNRETRR